MHQPSLFKRRVLALTLSLFLGQQWLGTAAAVAAGIVPAAGAPSSQHPLVDAAGNGVPIADIAPPSAAGVSNNLYSQFNVGTQGAILNNSPANVKTQLGGWIAGNPLLGTTPARVIINQVISGNPSQLLGALEVAGARADLVVANPNGIACNGCSFINTGHATLTTGTPQFDGAGNLTGFNVTQGTINVGANGLDAQQAERLDLDARNLTIGGGIWAQQLGVVAGAAIVPYGSTQAAAQSGVGNAPLFAVDVSALGGMYANTIDLIATDAGLGVNSSGRMAALQGNLRLSAGGDLTLANTSASGAVQLSGGNATLTGITQSTGGSVQVNAAGALTNTGQIDAASGLTLQAASITNGGTLLQRSSGQNLTVTTPGLLTNTGTVASASGLNAQAGTLTDTQGTWTSQGDLTVQADGQTLSGTMLQSGGNATLTAITGNLQSTGAQITTTGNLAASAAGALSNLGGQWQSGGSTTLQGASIANSGRVQASGALTATAGAALNNAAGQLLAGGNLTVHAATLTNDGGAIQSNQVVTASAAGALSNRGGTVSAGQTLAISTGGLDNTGGLIVSKGDAALATGATTNTGGAMASTTGTLTLNTQGQALENASGVISADTLQLRTGNLDNTAGALAATQGLTLNAQALTNANSGSAAGIQAGGPLTITAASLSNDTGFIGSNGNLDLSVGGLLAGGSGTLQSGAALTATAGQISSGGAMLATGPLALQAQTIALNGAALQSGTTTTLNATTGDVQTVATHISSVGDLSTTAAGALINTGGVWVTGGNATLNGTSLVNSGSVQASGNLNASAATLTNDGGTLASGAAATVTARQGVSNRGGTLSGASALTVDAGPAALNNASGTLVSGGAATVTTGALSNTHGILAASSDLHISSAALDNTQGRIQTTGNLALSTQGQALTNVSGKIETADTATLNTGALNNAGGTVSANAMALNTGALSNDGGNIVSATTIQAVTGAVSNAAGLMQAGTDLALNTQGATLSNTASSTSGGILAGGALAVQSGTLTNTGGVIASNGNQSLTVQGDLNSAGGSLVALGNLTASTTGTLGNAAGQIAAGGNATLNAAALDNTAGTIGAGRSLTVNASGLTNAGGTLEGNAAASVTTGSSSFGGTINSAGAVNLTVLGAYSNTGTVSTQGNLAIQAQSISNAAGATLASGGNLSATTSAGLTNAGTITAAGSTTLHVGGTLANAGLIDSGATTSLTAGGLNNTGRIYGNAIGVNAGSVTNTGGAVIASRGDMSIAAGTLANTGDSTILALGNLALAGSFDATTGVALTPMSSLLNASSTIQAGANMGIAAAAITNRNDHLVVGTQTTTQAINDVQVQVVNNNLQAASSVYDASQLGQAPSHWNGHQTWVLPSAAYPFATFGAVPIPLAIVTTGNLDSGFTSSYAYAPTDPVWQKFGVTPPPQAPTPPANAPVYNGYDNQGNPITLTCANVSGQPITTGACGSYLQQESAYNSAATQQQITQAEQALDNAIAAFNTDVTNRQMYAYEQFNLTSQTTTSPTVLATDPGKILAGGNLTVTGSGAGSLLNADSAIVAGGALNIASGALDNQSTTGTKTVTQTGNYAIYKFQYHGGLHDNYSFDYKDGGAYNPPPTSNPVNLNTVTVVQGAAPAAGNVPAAVTVAPSTATAAALAAPQPITTHAPGVSGVLPAQPVGVTRANAPPALQQVTVPAPGGAAIVVSTSPPILNLPGSQLFQVDNAPNAPYLVETDPAFTNQQSFLSSSDYLQQLGLDPSQWQKRYGDGFAEQQLVQNQILALTGRNLLASYSATQQEYQALMNAGVAYAKAYGIAPGVTLSAQQMALVTTDMVLLTTQTVTLPGGGTQQVLVPQVYLAHPQGQDLTQGGALIAGGTVTLTTAQDLVNSGTVGGSTVQANAGNDLVNSGTIAGQQVLLSASNDLQNLSGLIAGTTNTSDLSLLAGRDLVLQTQATAATSATGTTTNLGHVATVQGGSITLQAARDLLAQGAQITSGGDLSAVAGRNLTVGAATSTYQFATGSPHTFGAGNVLQASSSTQHGSTVTAGGNATLVAQGGDFSVNASSVTAGKDAVLSGQNVTIASGINTASRDLQAAWGQSTTHVTSSTETAAGASVTAGNNLTVQAAGNGQPASGNLTVTGARLTAQNGQATLQAANTLAVGGLALSSSATLHSQSESSGTFGSSSSTTQSSSTTTSNLASSVSGNTVAMAAGQDLTVTGSNVSGTGQVNLTAGNALNIVAAANTQTAHSQGQSSGGLFGRKSDSTTDLSQTTAQTSSITGGAITLQSGADLTLQAAQIQGNSLTAQAGTVGTQVVNPNAQLHIDAAINSLSQSSHSSGHDLLTQSTASQGQIQQTLQYTTIAVPGAAQANGPVKLQATGAVTVGASSLTAASGSTAASGTTPTITVDLKQQAQQLATQPGLAYLNQLAQRNDVNWQQVQLASQHWDYQASGLTGAAAAIIAVAVAVCTAGAGAALVGLAATSVGGAMASAAFTTLVTQASISLAGNGGNIGQTLHDLGSSASVHALLASIATAGLVNAPINAGQSLNQMAGLQTLGDTGRSLATGSVSTSTVEGITGRAVVSAGVSSALQGTSFQQGLVSSVVADTAAIGANAIGSTYGPTGTDPNAGLQTLAHGALGCAQGALTGGNCASGAAGAAAESVLGHVVDAAGGLPADGSGHNTTAGAAAYATGAAIGGAVAGQAAGGNAQSGANTAINAAANNYLTHNQIAQKQQDLSQAVSQEQKKQINSQYAALDAQQQQNAGTQQLGTLLGVQQGLGTPIQGCGVPTNCAANVQQSQQEINSAIVLNGGAITPIYPVETAAGVMVVGPVAVLGAGLNLSAMTAGDVLTASGIGATAGAGFDAIGQAIGGQPYRPAQTVISALTGAVAGPFATDSVLWNAVLGGTFNTANMAASNAMYGDSSSLYRAFVWGATGGALGTKIGSYIESTLSNLLPKYVGGSQIKPDVAIILQNFGHANPYPSAIGQAVNQTVSGTTPIIIDHSSSNSGSQP